VDHGFNCKLCDFGLSALNTDKSAQQKLAGSALYMAPEILNMLNQGPEHQAPDFLKADMYSLGLILIELFGGQVPWLGKSFQDILELHSSHTKRPCPPIQPQTISNFIQACLDVNPSKRPSSVQALSVLRNILNPTAATMCDECETQFSTVRCDECQQSLCGDCSSSLHKRGKRMNHRLDPLSSSALVSLVRPAVSSNVSARPPASPRSGAGSIKVPTAARQLSELETMTSVAMDIRPLAKPETKASPSRSVSKSAIDQKAKAALLTGGDD